LQYRIPFKAHKAPLKGESSLNLHVALCSIERAKGPGEESKGDGGEKFVMRRGEVCMI